MEITATSPPSVGPLGPRFVLGFAAVAEEFPAIVGRPLEDEQPEFSVTSIPGFSTQRTTEGILIWHQRVGDRPAFIQFIHNYDGRRILWILP